jgi:hypothetical protein
MKRLQTVYKALLMGQVLFAGLAVFIRMQGAITNVTEDISRVLQVVAVVFAFSSVWAGMSLYRKRIAALKAESVTAVQKISGYTSASLIKWAMTEGPCLFCIVGYLQLVVHWPWCNTAVYFCRICTAEK